MTASSEKPDINVRGRLDALEAKQDKQLTAYCCAGGETATTVTTITGTFAALNEANFGGTFTWAENTSSTLIQLGETNGCFEFQEAMQVIVNAACSYSANNNSTTELEMTIGIDSGDGTIVTKEAATHSFRTTTSTGEVGFFGLTCLPSLPKGAKLYLMLRRNTGTAEPNFEHINFTVHRL